MPQWLAAGIEATIGANLAHGCAGVCFLTAGAFRTGRQAATAARRA
jgi:hypothetical protein